MQSSQLDPPIDINSSHLPGVDAADFGRMVCFRRDGAKFTLRAAAVVVRDGMVLLTRGVKDDFWYLPGGRIELLESARDTIVREMREELGIDVTVVRLLWTLENFFRFEGEPNHELGLYFLVHLPNDHRSVLHREFDACEDNPIVFRWFGLDTISRQRIYPTFLRAGLLDLPESPVYVVHSDPAPDGNEPSSDVATRT